MPSGNLVRLANDFILSLQFTHWSECFKEETGQLVRANVSLDSLFKWRRTLPTELQQLLKLEMYFERS